jgi:hypothetical protein
VRLATSGWRDNATAKKASSFANLFAAAEDATTAMEAEREFARHWFPEYEHNEIQEIDATDIGDQSWAVQGGTDAAGFVEIAGHETTPPSPSLSPVTRASPVSPTPLAAGRKRLTQPPVRPPTSPGVLASSGR